MKAGAARPNRKKALTVATALTGAAAGATALLPATAAYASSGGWQIKLTMGAQVTRAAVCGVDLKHISICETASNFTGGTAFSVPFTENGIVRTFVPNQDLTFRYSGVTIGLHSATCLAPPGGGTMIWFANANRHSC